MSARDSLFSDALQAKANSVIVSLEGLHLMLGEAAHPQEFGMDGCPACKTGDLLVEASVALRNAADRIRLWQPERRSA